MQVKRSVRSILGSAVRLILPEQPLALSWVKRGTPSWLVAHLPDHRIRIARTQAHRAIEATAARINRIGAKPLWDGYRTAYQGDRSVPFDVTSMEREPKQVRTQPQMGRLFSWVVEARKPNLIVEIGTAFGVSAMYWASGLQRAGRGRLVTFEPNAIWQEIAAEHLRTFGDTVEPVLGTFEDRIDAKLWPNETIDMAFVDAIHTDTFVSAQIEMLIARLAPDGLVIVDDITFSDDMKRCWTQWSSDPRVNASVAVDARAGILEFALAR